MKFPILLLAGLLAWAPPLVPVHAQPPRPSEDAYYTISRFDLPEGEVLEAAGWQFGHRNPLLPKGYGKAIF